MLSHFMLLPVSPEVTSTDGKSRFKLPVTYVTQKPVKNSKNMQFLTTSGLTGSDVAGRILTTPLDRA